MPPDKTVGEIVGLLVRKGASTVSQMYRAGELAGVSFVMPIGELPVHFELPVNVDGVRRHMEARRKGLTKAQKEVITSQSRRTAWRILKDWVEVQIALVESQQADIGQVFMPYAIHTSGRSMYHLFVENNQRQLGSGGGE